MYHGLGSGKCASGDTNLITNKGLLKIKSLFESRADFDIEELYKYVGDTQILSYVNNKYVWQKIRNLYRKKNSSLIKFKCTNNQSVNVTPEHPLMTLEHGKLKWIKAKDLKIDDYLATANYIIEPKHPYVVDKNILTILCWLVTEGWEGYGRISITQDNVEVLETIQECFVKLGYLTSKIRIRKNECPLIEFRDKGWLESLQKIGYIYGFKSKDKRLPDWFLSLSNEDLAYALKIIFEAEGSCNPKRCIEITMASEKMIDLIQNALLRFGIIATKAKKRACATNGSRIYRDYYRLTISGEYVVKFKEYIGFYSKHKNEAVDIICAKKRNTNFGYVVYDQLCKLKDLGICAALELSENESAETINFSGLNKLIVDLKNFKNRAKKCKQVMKRYKGVAYKYGQRTLDVIENNLDKIKEITKELEFIRDLNLRFVKIKEIEKTYDQIVYDIEVDSDVYDHKNFIGGSCGFILHNTLTSILSAEQLKQPATVVVPASLQNNFEKEKNKVPTKQTYDVQSYEKFIKQPSTQPTLIIDEGHRLKNIDAKRSQVLRNISRQAKNVLLLTGSPIQNAPSDISNLVNIAAGKTVLPQDPKVFDQMYTRSHKYYPGIIGTLLGKKPSEQQMMINREDFQRRIKGLVSYHKPELNLPEVTEKTISIPMSEDQQRLYQYFERKLPASAKKDIQYALTPSKRDMGQVNSFLSATRQISNTTANYTGVSKPSPKLQAILDNLKETKGKSLVYSNFLDSGLRPLSQELTKSNIPHGVFTGTISRAEKNHLVNAYNTDKIKVLLMSSSAGEGLDLKGTRQIHLTDPHWHLSKLDQIVGRGVRMGSHESLPKSERNVTVYKYISELSSPKRNFLQKLLNITPAKKLSADEYLAALSTKKQQLNEQFLQELKHAS